MTPSLSRACEPDRFVVHTFPMLDTGIGQEMGYADDKAFLAATDAKREALHPDLRVAVEDLEREVQRNLFFGA